MTTHGVEFRVLGPLEAWSDGEPLALGGAKQRAVLAALLLRAGQVVPLERLVDEVWGDKPPPSAAHTLESYVSRLRQLLAGRGPVLSRRGAGYAIDLHGAELDALAFVRLHESAAIASALDEHANALESATAALGIWRGPALADVPLASAGRSEAERLEELRLRTFELRFDAELALGLHGQAVGELQALVAHNPYRERFVAQYMLALYRSGRHAEALDVYERTRRRLAADLGLQPSGDLQQLSGRIVRQDLSLERVETGRAPVVRPPDRTRRGRIAALAAAAAIVGSVLVLSASGGAAVSDRVLPSSGRLALVLPQSPKPTHAARTLSMVVQTAASNYGLKAQVAYIHPDAPQPAADDVAKRIRERGVGVVLALGDGPNAEALAKIVHNLPGTRFVFLDTSLSELGLVGAPNAAAIRFADEDVLLLAGYLAGLMPTMSGSAVDRVNKVSVVAAEADRTTARLLAGFQRGLRETRPRATVTVEYSHELEDPTACERLANSQIDDGSDLVVALSGRCGLGAVEVARIRGVWSIGAEQDGIPQRASVLLTTMKDWGLASLFVLEHLARGNLRMGQDTVLGLEDDYAVGVNSSPLIPQNLDSAMIRRCSRLRATRHRDI